MPTNLNRRTLLGSAAGLGAIAIVEPTSAAPPTGAAARIVDTNVSLFQWPFRRLPLDATSRLVDKLRELGITQAWAGSFEGVLHRDLSSANRRLAEECGKYPELVPIGSINVTLPDWREDLRRCAQEHAMPGIRLHPSYHGYTLTDSRFRDLVRLATEAGCLIQIATTMEDPRTQHPMMRVPDADLTGLAEVMESVPAARVQLLNQRTPLSADLAGLTRLYVDVARVESTDGVASLIERLAGGSQRVVFGSHAPFLIPESSLIRVRESGLESDALQSLLHRNAEDLCKPRA